MNRSKIYAAYLPQYHETAENNEFWGKGFTDWVAVRDCKPVYEGQIQPRKPLDDNYYDLSDYNAIDWQARIAKKYGIDGFMIYHYWFNENRAVLDKPVHLLREHREIDISYFFCWDNSSWIRSWSNLSGNAWAPKYEDKKRDTTGNVVLMEHNYGSKEQWEKHFYWLLPFFRDSRYEKINGKPVFVFFGTDNKYILTAMCMYWNSLAIENGLSGIYFITRTGLFRNKHVGDAQFRYQSGGVFRKKKYLKSFLGNVFHINKYNEYKSIISYDKAWNIILNQSRRFVKKHIFVTGIVRYDDTPRRGEVANIIKGETSEKFYKYFSQFYKLNCKYNMEFCLLMAWNEWGEGAYLEPDSISKYEYLEVVKKVVNEYET